MGSLVPFFLFRDSAQFGARRLTGDPGGRGNPPPLSREPLTCHLGIGRVELKFSGLSVSYFTHPTHPFSYVIERGGLAGSLPHVTNPPPSSA